LCTHPQATTIGDVTSVGRVGRYELLRVIGRGGMATVYLAHQADLDREVALKELMLTQGPEREVARRFLREARLASSFSHPNIVTVHDYFEQGGTPYIAMEYLPRGPLRPYVGRLSLAQVGGVLEGVLAGLAHAEERRVVHRDLKPENLMVTSQGGVKIADFGIAKATSEATTMANLTTTGTTLGTPRYMAPERALGQELGPWSDLYSVGVIAFELLVGRTPFSETVEPMAVLLRQINDPIPPVKSLVPDVDQELSDWIERLLVKEPEQRTRSATEAWDPLEEILIDRLGPRWQRGSGLPARPGEESAPVPASSTVSTRARLASAVTPKLAVAAVGSETTAATIAPRTVRPTPRRRSAAARRRLVLVALTAMIAVTFAADRVLGGGSPSSAARDDIPTVGSESTDLESDKSPSKRERAATKLAKKYDGTADDLRSEGGTGKLLDAVESTARAYRRAARAAQRGDGSDYDDAVADAHAAEQAIARAQGGIGDSQSDDASDDEPDGGDEP
jgi:tRNA A-37 threonylcarbamoyl transferase component Bud32